MAAQLKIPEIHCSMFSLMCACSEHIARTSRTTYTMELFKSLLYCCTLEGGRGGQGTDSFLGYIEKIGCTSAGLILRRGNKDHCLCAPWSLPWCPSNAPVEMYNFLIGYPLPKRKCIGTLVLSKTKHKMPAIWLLHMS